MSLDISDEFCSADYEYGVENVLSCQVSEKNGILWVKNHIFDHFHDIILKYRLNSHTVRNIIKFYTYLYKKFNLFVYYS